jgi:hypothetical protein
MGLRAKSIDLERRARSKEDLNLRKSARSAGK